jgi:hypothetical protein
MDWFIIWRSNITEDIWTLLLNSFQCCCIFFFFLLSSLPGITNITREYENWISLCC